MRNADLRTDIFTGRQVIIAPARANRPNASAPDPSLIRTDDPFETGNESETPGEHWALRKPGSGANQPGWQIRIVPNRYPAVEAIPSDSGMTGFHDVVIECPDRRSRMIELGTDELQEVLRAWQIRIRDFQQTGAVSSVVVFRNEGFSAGASLAHCHSQIIGTRLLLPEIAARNQRADEYRSSTGRHLSDSWLESELSAKTRIVLETERLVLTCPYAPRVGWQCTIIPRQHEDWNFLALTDEGLLELARMFRRCHWGLIEELGHFSFNVLLVHPPLNAVAAYPWMLELVPRLSRTAGWEMLTGIEIVTTAPEEAADRLRDRMTQLSEVLETGRLHPDGLYLGDLTWQRGHAVDYGITN